MSWSPDDVASNGFERPPIFQDVPPTCFASASTPLDIIERFQQHGGEVSPQAERDFQESRSARQTPMTGIIATYQNYSSLFLVLSTDRDTILQLLSSRPLVLYKVKWVEDSIEQGTKLPLGDYVIDPLVFFHHIFFHHNKKQDNPQSEEVNSSNPGGSGHPAAEDEDGGCSHWGEITPAQQTQESAPTPSPECPSVKRERSESTDTEDKQRDLDNKHEDARPSKMSRPRSSQDGITQKHDSRCPSHRSDSANPEQIGSSSPQPGPTPHPHWRTRQFFPRPEVQSTYKREPTPIGTIRQSRASSVAPSRSTAMGQNSSARPTKKIRLENLAGIEDKMQVPLDAGSGSKRVRGIAIQEEEVGPEDQLSPTERQDDISDSQDDDKGSEMDQLTTPQIKVEEMDHDKDDTASLVPTWKDDQSEVSAEEIEPVELKSFEIRSLEAARASARASRP